MIGRALSWLIRGRSRLASHLMLAPASAWLLAFLVLPVAALLTLGVTHRGPYGAFQWVLSAENFRRALNIKYLPVLARTVGIPSSTIETA